MAPKDAVPGRARVQEEWRARLAAAARVLAWAVREQRAVVTNNIGDLRTLHADSLKTSSLHCRIVLVSTGKHSLQRDNPGPLVAALDQLLVRSPAADALQDVEHFL